LKLSAEWKIPEVSPGSSIPVGAKNPKPLRYFKNFVVPIFCPMVIKAGLQEFCTACEKVWEPWPFVLAQRIDLSATLIEPPQ